jgi:hypothetical protein
MAGTSIAMEAGQKRSLREGLKATIRERVREIIELVLEVGGRSGSSAGCAAQPASGGAGRLSARIEDTEAAPAHGHRAVERAAGAPGGDRWR